MMTLLLGITGLKDLILNDNDWRLVKEKTATEIIKAFWDSRATLGPTAGSNDFILKDLETAVLLEYIKLGTPILDAGCGNGGILIKLARERGCSDTGVDFSVETILAVNKYLEAENLEEYCA